MGDVKAIEFKTQHRVRFREIDPYGHMNMAHYMTYLVDHRFDGMRTYLGLDYKALEELPIAFHTRKFEIDYILPLFAEEEFEIKSKISKYRNMTLWVDFEVHNSHKQLAVTASMKVGCIDRQTGRPTKWPPQLMDRFFEGPEQ